MVRKINTALRFSASVAVALPLICCTTTEPRNTPLQHPIVPTTESVNELFGVVTVDGMLHDALEPNKLRAVESVEKWRASGQRPPAVQKVVEEFVPKMTSVVNEAFDIERWHVMLVNIVQESFSQQDVDAITAFYRTKDGNDAVAEIRIAMRAFVEQRLSAQGAKAGGVDSSKNEIPSDGLSLGRQWENPAFAAFFRSNIGRDIQSRWPAAATRMQEAVHNVQREVQERIRQLQLDYNRMSKAAT